MAFPAPGAVVVGLPTWLLPGRRLPVPLAERRPRAAADTTDSVSDHALLPFIDAWSVDVQAPALAVWDTILESMPGPHGSLALRVWAVVWGADPAEANGLGSHVLGAERPGLAVCEVVRPATYALTGRHRFARYQLVFRIDQRSATRSRLTAETFADFPGTAGRLYRALVIDSRAHALVVRATLHLLRTRAERRPFRQD